MEPIKNTIIGHLEIIGFDDVDDGFVDRVYTCENYRANWFNSRVEIAYESRIISE